MTPTLCLIPEFDAASSPGVEADLPSAVESLRVQLDRDFAPIWGRDANVFLLPRGAAPPPGSWWIALLDDADQAGVLGYHELTPEGLPCGKVFLRTLRDDRQSWTVCLGHEALETLADPYCQLMAQCTVQGHPGTHCAYENCDACESDAYGYQVGKHLLSDFVTPAWFDASAPKGAKLDFLGHVTEPGQILPGGYIGVYTERAGWGQVTADAASPVHASAHVRYWGNRWHRRSLGRAAHRLSTAHAHAKGRG